MTDRRMALTKQREGDNSCITIRSYWANAATHTHALVHTFVCQCQLRALSCSHQPALWLTSACSPPPPRVPISRSDKQSNRMLCHVQLLAEFSRL